MQTECFRNANNHLFLLLYTSISYLEGIVFHQGYVLLINQCVFCLKTKTERHVHNHFLPMPSPLPHHMLEHTDRQTDRLAHTRGDYLLPSKKCTLLCVYKCCLLLDTAHSPCTSLSPTWQQA